MQTRTPLNQNTQKTKPLIRRPEEKKEKEEASIIPDLIQPIEGAKVQIISLGGLGEIGKNTWAFRYEDQILIIDAGLGFPNDQMQGVDLVLPELTYLIENQSKIVGMLITHGHEDHIGGVPNMLRSLNIPIIYGPPLAIGLIEGKLKEHGLLPKANLKRIKPRETLQLGDFVITFIRNNHSIPDSFSLVIQTRAGRIIHSGDFKFDHTPVDGELFDIAALSEASTKGVTLLISDSTNAERTGYTPSEKQVYPHLEEVFVRASKRIIITTFASQVHRIRQILEIATKYGRKVAILGRSMLNIALISRQLGYMTFPDGLLIRAEEVSQHPLNKIVVLTTGSQGEPLSALTRIANGSHKQISIIPGDTVVMSATPIPGNERAVATTINALFSRGAEVVYGRDAGVHVSGHCSQEEQKLMLSLVKPKFFMPAHGEYRMLVQHAKLAEQVCDLPPENTFVMENGDILEITANSAAVVGQVPAGIIMVDGSARNDSIKEETLKHRKQLSTQGVANLVLTLDQGQIVGGPDIVFKGLVFGKPEESQQLIEELKLKVNESWAELSKLTHDEIKSTIEGYILVALESHRQAPLVQIFILEPALV